jgi:fructokinase
MPAKKFTIVGLGELLWDIFEKGKQLGGAPANFAYITSLLGDRGVVASRVGKDRLGNSAARRLTRLGLSNSFLQIDSAHPTGTVQVQVDAAGQPKFQITENVAWDFFDWSPQWQTLAAETDAVCFGSLAQRSAGSRDAIRNFLRALRSNTIRIFDVNLRQSFYSPQILSDSAALADIIKLNQEELVKFTRTLGHESESSKEQAKWLLKTFGLQLVCVTRGEQGSLLVSNKHIDEHPGFPIKMADAVGAGDAFTAALVHRFLRGASLESMNEAANRMGAWVASEVGATPRANVKLLAKIREKRSLK